MIDPQILHALQGARKFVADELECRERSYSINFGESDESGIQAENSDITEARLCLVELGKAVEIATKGVAQ